MPSNLPAEIARSLLRELDTLRREVEAYPDDESVWGLPPGAPNSAGTLTLHLAGNLQHYVGALLGGTGYVRDRDTWSHPSNPDRPRGFGRTSHRLRPPDAT